MLQCYIEPLVVFSSSPSSMTFFHAYLSEISLHIFNCVFSSTLSLSSSSFHSSSIFSSTLVTPHFSYFKCLGQWILLFYIRIVAILSILIFIETNKNVENLSIEWISGQISINSYIVRRYFDHWHIYKSKICADVIKYLR